MYLECKPHSWQGSSVLKTSYMLQVIILSEGKGKVILLQARCDPEGG